METIPTFYAESNLEEIIIACSFVMTPDVEKASSDISLSVLKLPARIVSSPLYAEEERFSKIRRYLGEWVTFLCLVGDDKNLGDLPGRHE